MNDKTRAPGAGFWITIGLVVILANPLSFGPAVWLESRHPIESRIVERVYWPLLWAADYGPQWTQDVIRWWASLGIEGNDVAAFNVDASHDGLLLFYSN